MRQVAPLFALLVFLGSSFAADSLLPKHSLNMEAAVMSSGGASMAKTGLRLDPGGRPLGGGWSTAEQRDYSQKRKKESGLGLEVQVRNVGRVPDRAKLDWFFFARPVNDGDLYIFDRGSREITIDAASTLKIPLESKTLQSTTVKQLHTTNGVNAAGNRIPPSASVHKSGSVVGGWIVRLIVDDESPWCGLRRPPSRPVGRTMTASAAAPSLPGKAAECPRARARARSSPGLALRLSGAYK